MGGVCSPFIQSVELDIVMFEASGEDSGLRPSPPSPTRSRDLPFGTQGIVMDLV